MTHAPHIHVCARCQTEFTTTLSMPPPGWIWRGSRLYCDGCASVVTDPIDDAAPRPADAEPSFPPAPFMIASAKVIDLTNPAPGLIRIDDIALALSRICRFAGHTLRFYSVAEHCVMVSRLVPPEAALPALLHDASEAYLGDVTMPLKAVLPAYKAIEHRMEQAIDAAFCIDSSQWRTEIKFADVKMSIIEAHRLMPASPEYWGTAPDDLTVPVEGWPPAEARRRFLERFVELTRAAAPQQEAA